MKKPLWMRVGGWLIEHGLKALWPLFWFDHLWRRYVLQEKPPVYPEDKDKS